MNISRKLLIAGAAAAVVSAAASSALAQGNTANASAAIDAKILQPITIANGTTTGGAGALPLQFGTVISSATAGTVVVKASDSSHTDTNVTRLGSSPATTAANFTVGATPNSPFTVGYAASGTNGFTVDNFTTDGCGVSDSTSTTLQVSTGSSCTFTVGGTLHVPANSAGGVVAGTLTTTVTYN